MLGSKNVGEVNPNVHHLITLSRACVKQGPLCDRVRLYICCLLIYLSPNFWKIESGTYHTHCMNITRTCSSLAWVGES